MDLSLTEEQEMIKSSTREFVATEYTKDVLLTIDKNRLPCASNSWAKLLSTGLLSALIPSKYGGDEGSFTNAAIIFEELGRAPVPGPHLSAYTLAVNILLNMGNEEQKQKHLSKLNNGESIIIPAISDQEYGWSEDQITCKAKKTATGYSISTEKTFVLDGMSATEYILAANLENGTVGFFVIPKEIKGITTRALAGFAWHMSEVIIDQIEISDDCLLEFSSWDKFADAANLSSILLSAYQVGGCQYVYELSVEYSRTRMQFGTPIGRFQRVQDHIINLVNSLDAARWTTNEALWKIDSGKDYGDSIHLAQSVASQAYLDCCTYAHEVHAGIGSLTEYGLTLHTAASRTLYHYLGSPRFHRQKLAVVLGLI